MGGGRIKYIKKEGKWKKGEDAGRGCVGRCSRDGKSKKRMREEENEEQSGQQGTKVIGKKGRIISDEEMM